MAETKTYDPSLVLPSYAGVQITGLAPDTFIKVERNEDSVLPVQVSADGTEATRTINRNRSGKITITVLQTSNANDLFAAQQQLDDESGLGEAPFLLTDLNGTTLVVAATAWVTKPAAGDFGKELQNREWVLETGDLGTFIGGQL